MAKSRIVRIAAAAVLVLGPGTAEATNGYFSHGVGMKAKGMGGAAIAAPQDALSAGSNPAALGFVGDRADIGFELFRPERRSEITGNMNPPLNAVYDANGKRNFVSPELGFSKNLGGRFAAGIALYGRGGMNTSYTTPIGLFGTDDAGVDLAQLLVVPAISVRMGEWSAIGIGINFLYQRFQATGLENFTVTEPRPYSLHPDKITNNDYASSTGFGVAVGWMGRLLPRLAIGAAYQSKISASEFDEYAGLFAGKGDFDIPSSFGAGIGIDLTDRILLAFDATRILYTDVPAVSNPLLPNLGTAPLGDENGAGFGWEDMTVFKVGLSAAATRALTLRCGYNYGGQPIPASETLFNMLAPGVVEHHATFGATWSSPCGGELTFAYMHAFEKTVAGEGSIPPGTPEQGGMGGGEANLTMLENSFGLAYGRSF